MRVHQVLIGAALVAALMPTRIGACSFAEVSPDDVIENPKHYSRNGDYLVVARDYPMIGDFAAARRGDVIAAKPDTGEPFADAVLIDEGADTALVEYVVYQRVPGGFYRLGAFRAVPVGTLLVSDDGAFIVESPPDDLCVGRISAATEIRVFTPSGLHRSFTLTDVLTGNDLAWIGSVSINFALDEQLPHVLAIQLRYGNRKPRFANVNLVTGDRLDGKIDLLPPPYDVELAMTIEGRSVSVDPARFIKEYPHVAARARVQGSVVVDFTVDPDGKVTSTTLIKGLPFGLGTAAEAAVRAWSAPAEKGLPARVRQGTATVAFRLFPDDEEGR